MTEPSENLKDLIKLCIEELGINYPLLVHRYYKNYLQSIENGNASEAANAAVALANVVQKQQKYTLHRKLCEYFIEAIAQVDETAEVADLYKQLALTYDVKLAYDKSHAVFEAAFKMLSNFASAEESKLWKYYASLWYNRAQISRNGETDEELTAYTQKALHFYKLLNDKKGISISLNRLATLLPNEKLEEKIALFKQVVDIQGGEKGSAPTRALAEMNIGYHEIELGNFDYGISLMRESLKVFEQNNNTRYIALAYLHFARGLAKAGKAGEALSACDYAIEIFKTHHIEIHKLEAEELRTQIQAML